MDVGRVFPESGYMSTVHVYDADAEVWGVQCDTAWVEINTNKTCQEHGYQGGVSVVLDNDGFTSPYLKAYLCRDQDAQLKDCTERITVMCATKKIAGVFCFETKGL